MKRRLLLATPFLLAAARAKAQAWTEYRTDDGRFRVQLPAAPAVQKSTITVAANETAPTVEAVARAPGVTYQVLAIAYPRRIAQQASTDITLDHFRNNLAAGHTYRNEKPVTLGRVAGREFLLVEQGGRNVAVRLFWSRATLYSLMVSGAAGIEARPETRRFLESFEAIPV